MLDWIPSISTAALIGIVAFLGRRVILVRLARAVGYEFDKKIELLRSDLAAKQAQIEALRSGVLSSVTARQNLVFERRLKAIDELWSAVILMGPAKNLSSVLAATKFEEALQLAEKDEKVRGMFQLISGASFKFNSGDVSKSRPFVSHTAWAYFYAYQSILVHSVLRFELLKHGLNSPNVIDTDGVLKVVEAALPHQGDYLKRHGPGALNYVLGELESKILESLEDMMQSTDSDHQALEAAARILDAADALVRQEKAPNK